MEGRQRTSMLRNRIAMEDGAENSKKRRGAEGGSSFAATAMEDRAGNSHKYVAIIQLFLKATFDESKK